MNHTHLLPDTEPAPYAPPTPAEPTPVTGASAATEAKTEAEARAAKAKAEKEAQNWLQLSAAIGDQVPAIAEREDLTVTIGPGAGRGAPGCYIPALRSIELDSATLTSAGIDPTTCNPNLPSDRERYAALWGVLTHECAHARHSKWVAPQEATASRSTFALSASMLLEESRVEAAHLRRRPADRHWLRAMTTTVIMPDITTLQAATEAAADPADDPTTRGDVPPGEHTPAAPITPSAAEQTMILWSAAYAAGLVLARVDAGVLDEDETTAVSDLVTPILGPNRLTTLRDIWRTAQSTADDDADTMVRLGLDWCTALGVNPDAPDPTNDFRPSYAHPHPSGLTKAVADTLDAVRAADAPPDEGPGLSRRAAREAENASRQTAQRSASHVFTDTEFVVVNAGGDTAIKGTRKPSEAEKTDARRLARALREAGSRERYTVTSTSATPPGRLSMRGAMAADAQRAAGARPTAEPFTRTSRRHVPTPPLRVAIACDVSGSMSAAAPVIASTAWIVNRAVGYVTDARAATVIYGAHVRPITRPGQMPSRVSEFETADGTERFTEAIDALDGALDLTRRDAARLLVNVSDGFYKGDEKPKAQQRINRLRASGCAVLWISLNPRTKFMTGVTPVILGNPRTAADVIARAITNALRTA